VRLTFRVEYSHVDGERTYSSEVEMSDKTSMEVVEAHCKTMLKILADQAAADCDDDEEDDEDGWKETTGQS
jgi:hypothetical protein